jgi:nucleoside-diphosphate-sugar epimerase
VSALSPGDGSADHRSLVTGAAGFLGSHLVDRLLADGHTVVGVDNLLTGRRDNLASAGSNLRFRLLELDAAEGLAVSESFSHVWHLASPASPVDYAAHPVATLRAGAEGTRHALDVARRHDATFVLASTSEVYGDPEVSPQPETYWGHVSPVGPRSCYDEAKRYAEALTMAYHRTYGLRTRIARIFNTYGPRMRLDDGRVVPALVGQALRGQALTVHGDGRQTRSFCFHVDLIEAMVRLAARGGADPVNLGSQEEVTILELAQRVRAVAGRPLPILHLPPRPEDPRQRRPDLRRAQAQLRWSPTTTLDEGLRRTWAAFARDQSVQAAVR